MEGDKNCLQVSTIGKLFHTLWKQFQLLNSKLHLRKTNCTDVSKIIQFKHVVQNIIFQNIKFQDGFMTSMKYFSKTYFLYWTKKVLLHIFYKKIVNIEKIDELKTESSSLIKFDKFLNNHPIATALYCAVELDEYKRMKTHKKGFFAYTLKISQEDDLCLITMNLIKLSK